VKQQVVDSVDKWTLTLVTLLLLLGAGCLIISHVVAWRRIQRRRPEVEELDFRRRQFRRRMQTSTMLGLLAAAILVGELAIARVESLWVRLVFWGGVLLVVLWVGLLAIVDIWATKHHFGRLRQSFIIEEAKLHAELRRIQAGQSNGKAEDRDARPGD